MTNTARKDAIMNEIAQLRREMRGLSEKTSIYKRLKARSEELGQKLSELKKQ